MIIISISVFFTIIALFYYIRILQYYAGLLRLKPGDNQKKYSAALIIPARNEEANIDRCLQSVLDQDYPANLYQIHVVDDHSTDQTVEIVKSYQNRYPGRIQIHSLQIGSDPTQARHFKSYKKAAILHGIRQSQSDIIITTDADCWAQKSWLSTLMRHFYDNVGMVCGMIYFDKSLEKSVFHRLQSLEFLGLVIAGAGSMGIGQPVVSNGANLAYRRKVFEEVDGFMGIDHLPSGDDDLLMQKIHNQTKWNIRFAIEKEAHNYTHPEPDLNHFLNQRTRWASKSTHYHNKMITLLLILIYLFYLYIFAGMAYWLFFNLNYFLPLCLFLGKWIVEFMTIRKGCKLTGRTDLLKFFPLAQFFQIGYILFVGLRGIFGTYDWKGRSTKNYLGMIQLRIRNGLKR